MSIQVDDVVFLEHLLFDRSGLHTWNNQFGTSHDVGRSILRRKVCKGTCSLRKAGRYKVPKGASHRAVIAIDGVPHLVEEPTAITGHRNIFVHERGTYVTIFAMTHLQFQGHGSGVAGTDDFFGRMAVGIAAIHPVTRRVVLASLLDHFTDVGPFAALVACTPEEYSRLVAVAQHHAANTFLVHRNPLGVGTYKLGGMRLVARLVDDVESIACGILQVAWYGRIVRSANSIEAELFKDGHVLLDEFVIDAMASHGVLHVRTFGIDLQFLAIEVEYVIDHLGLFEAKVLTRAVDDVAVGIAELHVEGIEIRRLGRPLERIGKVLPEGEFGSLCACLKRGRKTLHRSHQLAFGIEDLCLQDKVAHLGRSFVASGGGHELEVGIAIVGIEVGSDIPVEQSCLRCSIDIDVVEDACQAPVVLSFEVEAVTVFDHEHRELVAPLLEVRGNVVLGWLLGTLVVAYFMTIDPKERG